MKVVTPSEMAEIDRKAQKDFGISPLILMEDAGMAASVLCMEEAKRLGVKSITVFCGPGNNGGDGLVVARALYLTGFSVRLYLIEKRTQTEERRVNLNIAKSLRIPIIERLEDAEADLLVDALLGTGISKPPSAEIARCIEFINKKQSFVVSLDIPSGLCGERGVPLGSAVMADITITFGLPKIGLLIYPGANFTGRLVCAKISFPDQLISDPAIKTNLLTEKEMVTLLPERPSDVYKSQCGKVMVVAGSLGMTGAAILCSKSALAMGAGLSYLCIPESLNTVVEASALEVITKPLPETKRRTLSPSAYNGIVNLAKDCDVAVIGPGISRHIETKKLIRRLVERLEIPIVLDADGLYSIDDLSLLKGKDMVITPHPGEMAQLLGISVNEVQADRIGVTRRLSEELGIVVILKGARSIIAENGEVWINTTGASGMATAGAGDVLSGMVGALIGQGLSLSEASCLATFLHGLSGETAEEEETMYSLSATSLIAYLPYAIKKVSTLISG
jgi:NAD(P)H-hydrate epimerase